MPSDAAATPTLVRFRLPDPPERHPDEVTSIDYVHGPGHTMHLARHLGQAETTLLTAERYVVVDRGGKRRVPDLLIAFDVNPELYYKQNGYIIAEQGKPPDFVLEVASPSTARIDTVEKRVDYARFGIREYWRFDHTGQSHGTRLAGDRLIGERYEPIAIVELSEGVLQGESAVLGLWLRWDHGELGWIDPTTGEHIPTFDSERAARIAERDARIAERDARIAERAARIAEREARLAAEARVRELELELRRREAR